MTLPSKPRLVTFIRNRQTAALVERAVGTRMEVFAATDVSRAQAWIEELEEVALVVAEHASDPSPGFSATSSAVTFLQRVHSIKPGVRRVLICSSPDLIPIIAGLHSGAIEHLLHCPFSAAQLHAALVVDESVGRISAAVVSGSDAVPASIAN